MGNISQRQTLQPTIPNQLAIDEVQVWCASLDVSQQDLERYSSLLSPDEETRAERFYFERDHNHFIAGRGLLRTLLGGYLGIEPSGLEFGYEAYGKPFLKSTSQNQALQFNLSHSNSLAVYAFSWQRRVGIDVEYVRSMENEKRFVEQLYTPQESLYLQSLVEDQKTPGFFKIWTCKEAFLKACGAGLTTPINQVDVLMLNEVSARLVAIDGDEDRAANWRLAMFEPAAGYQAAIACEGHAWRPVFKRRDVNS